MYYLNTSQVTNSLKGNEERDFIFAKLFGYIALMKTDRLLSICINEDVLALDILQRILKLQAMKGWLREVISEVLLEFFQLLCNALLTSPIDVTQKNSNILKICMEKICPLMSESLSDMSAWQIMLQIGFQNLAATNDIFRECFREYSEMILHDNTVSLTRLDDISATLLAATSGFPKVVHLSLIFDSIVSNSTFYRYTEYGIICLA